MKTNMLIGRLALVCACLPGLAAAQAVTNYFFTGSQPGTVVSSNVNAITLQSGDYQFTYSADGYWASSPGGQPTGRFFSVYWPTGVQAQAITAGTNSGAGANISIKRADGKPFDLWAFTGKLLANTGGAGGAFEITPVFNGNDATNAPIIFDASGSSGQSFSYTPMLQNYDTYKIHLWVDWALTALTLIDTNPVTPPELTRTITATASPLEGGIVGGAGIYASNATCTLVASAYSGWSFKNWTENGAPASASSTYMFTVRSNRTLVANFVPAFSVTTAVSPAYGGTVSAGGTFSSNTLVTVTATPISGFRLVNWTDYGSPVSTSAAYSFNVTGNRALVANFAPAGLGATFDFDTGTPAVGPGQGLPSTQTGNGVTASFSTLAGAWSVQNNFYYGWTPAVFSGNFLYPSVAGSALAVEFSQPVTNFTMTFFTGEVSSEYDTAAQVRVTAYTNATLTNPVATGTASGAWVNGAYPSGTLSFGSATPFTRVKIEVPSQTPAPSYLMFVDNLIIQLAAPNIVTINATASPADAGFVTGAGPSLPGDTVFLSAFANGSYHFANWTENGVEVSTSPDYIFDAVTNRALIAHFTMNHPPLAFGSGFFQVTGQPLAINIADLMWLDYDPDFDPISLVGVSATTTNGLPLTTDATRIFVPANAVPDAFSYTIADSFGATATSTGTISIIPNVTSRGVSLNRDAAGVVTAGFTGVPWYFYTCERATNAVFTGALQTWPVQAWFDGSIYVGDDFADLTNKPPQAFYRLRYNP